MKPTTAEERANWRAKLPAYPMPDSIDAYMLRLIADVELYRRELGECETETKELRTGWRETTAERDRLAAAIDEAEALVSVRSELWARNLLDILREARGDE